MPASSSNWILVNIRESWKEFDKVVTDFTDPAWEDLQGATGEITFQCRTPIAYLDRENFSTQETRDTAAPSGYETIYDEVTGAAAVGIYYWGPVKPPSIPANVGIYPSGPGSWTEVRMLDTTFEHDNNSRNGMVHIVQSLEFSCDYVEFYSPGEGRWAAFGQPLTDLLWPLGTGGA